MRRPERIPIISKLIRLNKNISDHYFEGIYHNKTIRSLMNKNFEDYWKDNPDQRLGQVMYNLDLISDKVYQREEVDWLIGNKYIKPEEILFWGNNYDKDMNLLPETKYILLKDLTTNHIKNIIKYFKDRNKNINPMYLEYFNKRIDDDKRD